MTALLSRSHWSVICLDVYPTSSKTQGPKSWSIVLHFLPTSSSFPLAFPGLAHCFFCSLISSLSVCFLPLPLLSFPPPTSLLLFNWKSLFISGPIPFSTLGDGTHFQLHKTSPRAVFLTREHSFCGQAQALRDSVPNSAQQPPASHYRMWIIFLHPEKPANPESLFSAPATLLFELFSLKPFLVGFCNNMSQKKDKKKWTDHRALINRPQEHNGSLV